MRERWVAAKAIGVLAGIAVLASPALAAEGDSDSSAIARESNAFALDLYAKLSARKGNLFFSPYSVSTALAMTYAGARGQTAAQMARALHFKLEPPRLHAAFGRLVAELNDGGKRGNYSLVVANALWAQRGYPFLTEFLDLVQSAYGGGVQEVDFRTATEAARQTINRWVEKQTNDKIKNLIPPRVLTELTRLVLTNAIYFKATWHFPFREEATKDGPFTILGGEKVNVPMMHQTALFGYFQGDGFQALELPYKGGSLSMVIFLPAKADGLTQLETGLTAGKLADWLSEVSFREVVVTMPKFKVTTAFTLNETLKAMGMTDAFSADEADFSGMNGRKDLFIQAALHKAYVDVNEKGTEAAAATAVVMGLKGAMPQPKAVFRADHPFLFLIRHRSSGSILFLGRVANPKE